MIPNLKNALEASRREAELSRGEKEHNREVLRSRPAPKHPLIAAGAIQQTEHAQAAATAGEHS